MLNGNQRLMYCGLLCPIHGGNLNPFGETRKPCGRRGLTASGGGDE